MKIPFFKSLKKKKYEFDQENERAVLKSSICTKESVAGFLDKRTGKFREERLIKNEKELSDFLKDFGLSSIKREW